MAIEAVMVSSPIGDIGALVRQDRIVALTFEDSFARQRERATARFDEEILNVAAGGPIAGHIAAYFAGDVIALDGLELDAGGTDFQQHVWQAVTDVAPATTCSYGDVAAAIGRPRAARAVGAAVGANPVALAIPCHRVIGSDGSLTGYACGIDRKHWLLDHERRHARRSR